MDMLKPFGFLLSICSNLYKRLTEKLLALFMERFHPRTITSAN